MMTATASLATEGRHVRGAEESFNVEGSREL